MCIRLQKNLWTKKTGFPWSPGLIVAEMTSSLELQFQVALYSCYKEGRVMLKIWLRFRAWSSKNPPRFFFLMDVCLIKQPFPMQKVWFIVQLEEPFIHCLAIRFHHFWSRRKWARFLLEWFDSMWFKDQGCNSPPMRTTRKCAFTVDGRNPAPPEIGKTL